MKKFLLMSSVILGLSGCASDPSTPSTSSTTSSTNPMSSDEPLQDRYWRAVEIDGKPLEPANGRAEPHIIMDKESRAHGSDGCNRFHGTYEVTNGLRFGRMATTMMACMPPFDAVAQSFAKALVATTNYRIQKQQLELLGSEGQVLMRLEATFLK